MHKNRGNVHNASASFEKSRTTLFLENEIRDHARENKVNLSEFLNQEYRSKYLSLQAKVDRLADLQEEAKALASEIQHDQERSEAMKLQLTDRERRYLATVMPRRREGKDMAAMWRFFNQEHGRGFTFAEFEELVRLYEEQAEKRAAYAMSKARRKR